MSCGDRSRSPREGRINHTFGLPWAQGTPGPSRQPSLPVFKRRAFDHLLGLKIFYAKSSGPLRSRTGVLAPWLLGPCPLVAQQHLLQFRLGEPGAGVAAVPSLWAYATQRLPQSPPPGQGGDEPLLSASWPGAPDPRGLYIHFYAPPLPCHMHVIFYSQSEALPPASCALPAPAGVLGARLNRGLRTVSAPGWILWRLERGTETKAVDNLHRPSVDLEVHLFFILYASILGL